MSWFGMICRVCEKPYGLGHMRLWNYKKETLQEFFGLSDQAIQNLKLLEVLMVESRVCTACYPSQKEKEELHPVTCEAFEAYLKMFPSGGSQYIPAGTIKEGDSLKEFLERS
jgi:hypothetical protein